MSASKARFSDDTFLNHVAHRPQNIIRSVIPVDENAKLSFPSFKRIGQSSPKPSNFSPTPSTSPIGRLDGLPLEVLHESLRHLDPQSLSRFSRVSLGAKLVVESLLVYRELLLSAGHIFAILRRTKTINLHSVAILHATLRSDRCASCRDCYGPFLFLLSAERCCYACLFQNRSLWMIPLPLARDCFSLSFKSLKELPVLRSVPGQYSVGGEVLRKRAISLTSVKAAKQLALRVHGSASAMGAHLAKGPFGGAAYHEAMPLSHADWEAVQRFHFFKWLHAAPMEYLPKSNEKMGSLTSKGQSDEYCGMGSIPFPSITNNGIEYGIWCRGCERTNALHMKRTLQGHQSLVSLLICERLPFQDWIDKQYRARSKSEFLEHINLCHSATKIVEERLLSTHAGL